MSDLASQRSAGQLLRYGIIGIATNTLGYLVYLLITYSGVEPKLLITFMYPIGATIGFFGNRQWSFTHKGSVLKSGIRYFVAHFFGYLINFLILLTFVDRLSYPHQWVQAVAIIVVAGFLFLVFKYFVFPKAESCVRVQE
jgi:putative flippase GtrA